MRFGNCASRFWAKNELPNAAGRTPPARPSNDTRVCRPAKRGRSIRRIVRDLSTSLRSTQDDKEEDAEPGVVRLLAARLSHAQGSAKVRDESFTKFDGITGGQVRPLGAV